MLGLQSFEQMLSQVQYKDWQFSVSRFFSDEDIELRIVFEAPDAYAEPYFKGPKNRVVNLSLLPAYGIENERFFAQLIMERIKYMELHEAAEWFKFKGKRLFNPHKNDVTTRLKGL